MSAIPSSAMPHAYAEEGENLRDPQAAGATAYREPAAKLAPGWLIGGAAVLAVLLYRALR